MKKFKFGLLLVIIATLSILLLFVMTSVRKKNFTLVVKAGLKKADIHIGNFSFFQTNRGGKEWELNAQKAELFEGKNKAVLEQINVKIHAEKGMEISFHGDEGIIDTRRKNFHIQNKLVPIRINVSNQYQIEMMQIDWDNDKKQILSESPVVIHGENWDVKGTGLILNTTTEEFTIKRDIAAQLSS